MARTPKSSGRRQPVFESDVSRSPGRREARDRLLVVCGARVTERDYVQGLVDHLANPAVTVKIRTKACSPSQLVRHAAGERHRTRDDFDEVWCVFDVDEFEVAEAVREAQQQSIRAAVSNPCFELWLLLHFRPHTAHAARYRDLLPLLQRHIPAYDKARLTFRHYEEGWREAGSRARRLAPAGREHERNPATGVWALVDRIAGH